MPVNPNRVPKAGSRVVVNRPHGWKFGARVAEVDYDNDNEVLVESDQGYRHDVPQEQIEHIPNGEEKGDHPRLEMTDEDRAWAEHARQREAERKQNQQKYLKKGSRNRRALRYYQDAAGGELPPQLPYNVQARALARGYAGEDAWDTLDAATDTEASIAQGHLLNPNWANPTEELRKLDEKHDALNRTRDDLEPSSERLGRVVQGRLRARQVAQQRDAEGISKSEMVNRLKNEQKFLYTFLVNQAKSIALTNHLFKQLTKAIKGPNRVDKIVADDALYDAGLEALNENEIPDLAERNIRQASHTRQRPLYVGDERETIRDKDRRPTINAVRNAKKALPSQPPIEDEPIHYKPIKGTPKLPRTFPVGSVVRTRRGVGRVVKGPHAGYTYVQREGQRSVIAHDPRDVQLVEGKSIKAIRKDVADRAIEDGGNISRLMPAEGAARYHNIMSQDPEREYEPMNNEDLEDTGNAVEGERDRRFYEGY